MLQRLLAAATWQRSECCLMHLHVRKAALLAKLLSRSPYCQMKAGPQLWAHAALVKLKQLKHAQGHSPLMELPNPSCAALVMHEATGTHAANFAGGSIRQPH